MEDLRDLNKTPQNTYLNPADPNFSTFDSFIHPNNCFQITVSLNHPIKISKNLNTIIDLNENGTINFYFVVPSDKFDEFKIQELIEAKVSSKLSKTQADFYNSKKNVYE